MGETILSGVMMIFSYTLVIVVLWKVFQISTELGEVKTLLKEMRQTPVVETVKPVQTVSVPPPAPVLDGPISLASAEALLREVAAESHSVAASEYPKTTV